MEHWRPSKSRGIASSIAIAAVVLGLTACFKDPAGETAGGSGGMVTTEGTATGDATTGGSTGTTGDPETTSDSETTGTAGCIDDDDCPAQWACVDGRCAFGNDTCGGEAVVELSISAPDLILVVDKSGSMVNIKWDHDDDPNTAPVTRWFSLANAIGDLVSRFDRSLNLGLVLYPSLDAVAAYEPVACLMGETPEVAVAPENGAAVLEVLPPPGATQQIQGATPARLGIATATAALEGSANPERSILFITDNPANCSPEAEDNHQRFEAYDHGIFDAVDEAALAGIATAVIGLEIPAGEVNVGNAPDTETIDHRKALSVLAQGGGVPKDDPEDPDLFYNAYNQLELTAALETIVRGLLPCTVTLDPPPVFPDAVEVTVGGVFYGDAADQVGDCASEDGWRYVDDPLLQIELCGQACADFQEAGVVYVTYTCD